MYEDFSVLIEKLIQSDMNSDTVLVFPRTVQCDLARDRSLGSQIFKNGSVNLQQLSFV